MSFSRRKFLQHGTMAALACSVPWQAWSANKNSGSSALGHITGKVSNLTRQLFENAVGSSFKVSSGDANVQPAWLTLAAVNDLPALAPVNEGSMAVPPPKSNAPVVTTEGFMVSFSGGPSTELAQGTYTFENDALGTFKIFIVPASKGMQSYTAVFNDLAVATAVPAPTPSRRPGTTRPGTTPHGGNSGIAGSNVDGSDAGGLPVQEPVEPLFARPLKSKLPE